MKDLEFFKLEERVLFEAAAVAEIVEAADAASQPQESSDTNGQDLLSSVETLGNAPVNNDIVTGSSAIDPEQLADVDAELNALIDGVIPGNAEDQVSDTVSVILQDKGETVSTDRELVIIDSSLKDIDSVLEQIRPDQDVLILEDNNGMTEINEYLSEQEEKYSAVHFITHGDNDGIIVNDQIINQQTFNAEDWTGLKEHLTSDGEILFYGCSIAEKSGGKELIDQISEVCNADVAASTDVTGITGNWELEYATGSIDAVTIQIDAYQSDLAETIVSTYKELYDALEDAAVNGGDDYTITISNDITIDSSYADLSFLIRKDLNLTIKGLNADIKLTGGNGVNIFEFYEYDAEAYQIEISIDSLNFNGQGNAASAVLASGVEKLTISNSKIENFINTAVRHESYGGAETLVINGVQFLNNSASTYSGGAVSAFDVSVTIDGSYFYNNSSTQMGGALEIQGAPVLTISNSTFERNKNAYDGGAVNVDMGTDGVVNIDNTTFYDNMTEDAGTGGSGGALCIHQNDDSSTVTITNSTFTKNTIESTGEGRAFYLSGKGNAEIINTLLIGEGESVVANESSGTLTLSYSLATSSKGSNIVLGTNAEVNAEFTHENVFGSNTYESESHTIAPDAFHKAAWSGTNTGTGLDQLEISRETINNIPGLSGKYTIGAVTAAAGLIVTQGDYSTDYTGSVIQPEANLTLAYADGTVMSQTVTATLTSNPGTILEIGDYTITPSDASVTGIDAEANVEYQYVSGTLTVEAWEEFSIQDVTINSTYGDTPDLSSTYTFTTLDNTGNDIELTVNVTWEIDTSVITDGDYSATDHLNAKLYADSLTVKDFTVRDQNGNDMKSCFTWVTSAKSDLDVAQKTVTITLNDLTDKSYNGKTDDAEFNGGTVSGVISEESLNVTVDPGEYGVYNSKNIDATEAAFTVVLAAGTNTDLANYSFNDQAVAKAKITPATLNISVKDQGNITYGDSVAPSHTVTGLCSPDTVSVTYAVSGAVSTSGNYAVGDHTITIFGYTIDDGMDGKNYNVETVGDSFKVSERLVTVTIDGALFNKVYDGTTATETADNNSSSSDIIAGDVVEISGNFVYDNKNADTGKTVTMNGITLSGTDAGNYKLTSDVAQGNNAVITPLELNVSVVVPDNKVYDGTTSVDSKVSADNIIQGDDVVIDAAWDYNSPDVDATTVSNSSWQLSGADAGNYSLPAVDPYQEFPATISGKPVDTVFETDSPYYYNGTDQSGSVSAYYIDINGNKVQLTINWNGKVFKNAGDYMITAESNDQNYVPVGNSLQLTMNFPAYQPHVYCEGLYPGYFNTMQGMRAELESMDGVVQGDIYTMTYPELVSRTMLHFNMPDMQTFAELYRVGGIASVDSLKYYPFEIDEPVREISVSVIGSSKLTHESSLYSGEELFTEHGDQEFIQLFGQRGDTLSVDHKPLCVEDGAVESEELSAGYVFLPESMAVPSRFFAMDRSLDEQFRNLTAVNEAQCRRVNNLKSNLEKLLDDLCFA